MISVIVPAKDASKTITGCLESLLRQDGLRYGVDYEVVVVDDGSADNTAEIAERYGVNIIRQANMGPSAARNAGARIARGELLAFTDADCAPTPGWLSKLIQPLDQPGIVGVKGAYLTHQTGLVSRFVQLEYEYKEARLLAVPSIDFVDTYSAAYRKDVFLQNAGFDESFGRPTVEDIEFSFRLARKGYRMVFEPSAAVFHHHDQTISEYFHRKFLIGSWGAYILRWASEKMFTDSRTAPTQRLEIILMGLLLIALPLTVVWPIFATYAFLVTLAAFLVITLPFQVFIARRDRKVLWVASVLLFTRAAALGIGLLSGFLLPPKSTKKQLACQSMTIRAAKRLLDVLGGGIGLVLSAPVIGLAALAVRLDSPGPVFSMQVRGGEFGRAFTLIKLRTIVSESDRTPPQLQSLGSHNDPTRQNPANPQITRVGRFLRRWRLDELPEFWNVLKGDMSLVGPLSEAVQLVHQYTDEQRQRLLVKPGITGPVQVDVGRVYDFDQRIQLELEYLKHYSLVVDLKIILKTFSVVILGEGAV